MKDYKDEKKTPNQNEESFAYDGGIGDPDKNWQKNMEIDENPESPKNLEKDKDTDDSKKKR